MSSGGGGSSGSTPQSTGGGSQGSGKISYPAYLQAAHDDWIRHGGIAHDGGDVDMEAAMYEAWDASPYENAFPYDPTDDVAQMHARFGTYDQYVGQLDPIANWGAYVDAAADKFDEHFDDDYIDGLVQAYREQAEENFDREQGRWKAGMADANAAHGSAFIIAAALRASDVTAQTDRFARELRAQALKERIGAMLQWQSELRLHLGHQIQANQQATQLHGELRRVGIVARAEHIARDVEYAVQNRSWNLQLWQPGANLLAAVSGGVTSGGSTTKGHDGSTPTSAIGGAITGGIGGVMAGAGAGPIGMLAGGALGAYMGSKG